MCNSMIERQMARPIPIPCCLVVKNGSKTRSASVKPVPDVANLDADRIKAVKESTIWISRAPLATASIASNSVPDRIHEHLLHLNAIERDRRQIRLESRLDVNATFATTLVGHESTDLADEAVEVLR